MTVKIEIEKTEEQSLWAMTIYFETGGFFSCTRFTLEQIMKELAIQAEVFGFGV